MMSFPLNPCNMCNGGFLLIVVIVVITGVVTHYVLRVPLNYEFFV